MSDTYQEYLEMIIDGNPGAMTAVSAMVDLNRSAAPFYLGKCLAYKITGPMLWLVYKDICRFDVREVFKIIGDDTVLDKLEGLHYSGYKRPKYE